MPQVVEIAGAVRRVLERHGVDPVTVLRLSVPAAAAMTTLHIARSPSPGSSG